MARWKLNKDGIFIEVTNPNIRSEVPNMKIREANLLYIADFAKTRGISRSRAFERIVVYMLNNPLKIKFSLYLNAGSKRKRSSNKDNQNYRSIPKFYISSLSKKRLEALKKKRGVSYTVLVDEMILSYRREYSFFDKLGNVERLLSSNEYFEYNSPHELENFINFLANVGGCKDIFINQLKAH